MSIVIKAVADQINDYEPYGWIIDEDHITGSESKEIGRTGPSGISPDIEARLKAGEGRPWRMYDGDQELNYSGRILTPNDPEGGGQEDFAPLDDYGRGGAGCTEIHYYDATRDKWTEL